MPWDDFDLHQSNGSYLQVLECAYSILWATVSLYYQGWDRLSAFSSHDPCFLPASCPEALTVCFDKDFPPNIMYPNIFLISGTVPQIHCPIAERAGSMDFSSGSICRYYLEERYAKQILSDSKVVQGSIRRWWDRFDIIESLIVLEGIIREGDCQQGQHWVRI